MGRERVKGKKQGEKGNGKKLTVQEKGKGSAKGKEGK